MIIYDKALYNLEIKSSFHLHTFVPFFEEGECCQKVITELPLDLLTALLAAHQ